MFDDFESDTNLDFRVEQRATERLLQEINASGFRDGHQKFMENESLMQSGFDHAYKLFFKLAFLVGKVKALSLHSSVFKSDSLFLAKVSHKLESLEKFEFAGLIAWKPLITYNVRDDQNVEAKFDGLEALISNFESQLALLTQCIGEFNISRSSNDLARVNYVLDNLSVASVDSNCQQESDELNSIIGNLNIKP